MVYELFNMNIVVRSCHNWIVDELAVKGWFTTKNGCLLDAQ